jgi:uncharacterized protein
LTFNILGLQVHLLPEKALLLPENKVLILSDLHLGKVEHFRASGIGLPAGPTESTLITLDTLIHKIKPTHIIFLGDLFHSRKNTSYSLFEDWRYSHREIQMSLIHGNHDIMSNADYLNLGLDLYFEYQIGPLWLTHEPQTILPTETRFNLAGHIHPGIRLKGKGKQSLTLPCFWFTDKQGIVPAFGQFTGKYLMDIHENSTIFAIANDQIIKIK